MTSILSYFLREYLTFTVSFCIFFMTLRNKDVGYVGYVGLLQLHTEKGEIQNNKIQSEPKQTLHPTPPTPLHPPPIRLKVQVDSGGEKGVSRTGGGRC